MPALHSAIGFGRLHGQDVSLYTAAGLDLFLLVSGAVLLPSVAPVEGPSVSAPWQLPPGVWASGLTALLLILRPAEAPPFPWLNWRVRWVVRRRRLADMTLEELLALLPPGVRTIAQLGDVPSSSRGYLG
ncbi:MAG: hypothetical protein ACE5LU_29510 [Anaerolineae bacterium]